MPELCINARECRESMCRDCHIRRQALGLCDVCARPALIRVSGRNLCARCARLWLFGDTDPDGGFVGEADATSPFKASTRPVGAPNAPDACIGPEKEEAACSG